jgi:hypothetical protein
MNATESIIFTAYLGALNKMEDVDNDLNRLSPAVRTFFLVHAAQGTMDNGGYRYFFTEDWPGTPPYQVFISAYETIGCRKQAAELERVVNTFPFPDPHLHKDQREAFIDSNYDKVKFCVPVWGNALRDDNEVWDRLAKYYRKHEAEFD